MEIEGARGFSATLLLITQNDKSRRLGGRSGVRKEARMRRARNEEAIKRTPAARPQTMRMRA